MVGLPSAGGDPPDRDPLLHLFTPLPSRPKRRRPTGFHDVPFGIHQNDTPLTKFDAHFFIFIKRLRLVRGFDEHPPPVGTAAAMTVHLPHIDPSLIDWITGPPKRPGNHFSIISMTFPNRAKRKMTPTPNSNSRNSFISSSPLLFVFVRICFNHNKHITFMSTIYNEIRP